MKNAILEKFRRGEPSLGIISHLLSAPAIEVLKEAVRGIASAARA